MVGMNDLDSLAQSYLDAKLKEKDQELSQAIHQAKVSMILSIVFFFVFFALALFSISFYWEINGVQIHDYVAVYFSFLLFVAVVFAFMSVAYFLRKRRYQKERADLAAHLS
jgi:uncharacterized membrane protein